MVGDFDIKKHSLAELALLGLFVLGLFLGYLIVSLRNRITLSEPFRLDFADFSVAMPAGRGWDVSQGWQYKTDSSFNLLSVFSVTGKTDAVVQCRLFLASEALSAQQHLEAGIHKAAVKVLKKGRVNGSLKVYWARVETAKQGDVVFLGYGVLPGQRLLEVEAVAFAESGLVEAAFMAVLESIEVFENPQQAVAEKFIEHLRTIGASELITAEVGQSGQRIYVTAAGEEVEGFMVDFIERIEREKDGPLIRNQKLHYTSNDKVSGNCILECNEQFDNFYWDSRHGRKGVRSISHIHTTLGPDGDMRVKGSELGKEVINYPSRQLLPGALVEPAVKAFLDFAEDAVVFDVVFSRGIIVPVRMSKMDPAELKDRPGEAAYGVRIDFLHQEERYQEIYFDAEKKISRKLERRQILKKMPGKLERRQISIVWDRVDIEALEERFPDWRKEVEKLREEIKADV